MEHVVAPAAAAQDVEGASAPSRLTRPVTYEPLKEETLDEEKPSPGCLVKENEPAKQGWDLVIMVCILYSAVTVPLRLCFRAKAEGNMWTFEASMSLVFLADLCLAFNTAFLREDEWVTDRKEIRDRYLRGWFWVDAPSSLPVEFIELLLTDTGHAGALPAFRILRLLRLVRMLKLLRVRFYIQRLEESFDIDLRPLRVVELIMQMLFISHSECHKHQRPTQTNVPWTHNLIYHGLPSRLSPYRTLDSRVWQSSHAVGSLPRGSMGPMR